MTGDKGEERSYLGDNRGHLDLCAQRHFRLDLAPASGRDFGLKFQHNDIKAESFCNWRMKFRQFIGTKKPGFPSFMLLDDLGAEPRGTDRTDLRVGDLSREGTLRLSRTCPEAAKPLRAGPQDTIAGFRGRTRDSQEITHD